MKKITIKHGWFFAAGNVYGWHKQNKDLHVFGVGVDMEILKKNDQIKVSVAGEDYILNCKDALNFIEQYRSIKAIRNKRIGIVSKSLLQDMNARML